MLKGKTDDALVEVITQGGSLSVEDVSAIILIENSLFTT
jgi:hypothetical protein